MFAKPTYSSSKAERRTGFLTGLGAGLHSVITVSLHDKIYHPPSSLRKVPFGTPSSCHIGKSTAILTIRRQTWLNRLKVKTAECPFRVIPCLPVASIAFQMVYLSVLFYCYHSIPGRENSLKRLIPRLMNKTFRFSIPSGRWSRVSRALVPRRGLHCYY